MTSEPHDALQVLVAQLVDDFRLPKPREKTLHVGSLVLVLRHASATPGQQERLETIPKKMIRMARDPPWAPRTYHCCLSKARQHDNAPMRQDKQT